MVRNNWRRQPLRFCKLRSVAAAQLVQPEVLISPLPVQHLSCGQAQLRPAVSKCSGGARCTSCRCACQRTSMYLIPPCTSVLDCEGARTKTRPLSVANRACICNSSVRRLYVSAGPEVGATEAGEASTASKQVQRQVQRRVQRRGYPWVRGVEPARRSHALKSLPMRSGCKALGIEGLILPCLHLAAAGPWLHKTGSHVPVLLL